MRYISYVQRKPCRYSTFPNFLYATFSKKNARPHWTTNIHVAVCQWRKNRQTRACKQPPTTSEFSASMVQHKAVFSSIFSVTLPSVQRRGQRDKEAAALDHCRSDHTSRRRRSPWRRRCLAGCWSTRHRCCTARAACSCRRGTPWGAVEVVQVVVAAVD